MRFFFYMLPFLSYILTALASLSVSEAIDSSPGSKALLHRAPIPIPRILSNPLWSSRNVLSPSFRHLFAFHLSSILIQALCVSSRRLCLSSSQQPESSRCLSVMDGARRRSSEQIRRRTARPQRALNCEQRRRRTGNTDTRAVNITKRGQRLTFYLTLGVGRWFHMLRAF